ncbi:hypothetical protein [uncultured Bacteroides sp.]|uniref:hypothetical protein n=1 Tax=uncultured Bacteroides sp. TaxID=162156 RepID=UPI0025EAC9A1|nr:hypothetical protein [uncultured Bacteroides sp.]
MRTLLIALSFCFSLVSQAQITYKLSYDKDNKIVNLNLTNQFDELVVIEPRMDDIPEAGTYYTISYKDIKGNILSSSSNYVFKRRSDEIFIDPKKSKDYKINLRKQFKGDILDDIYMVEIEIYIHARSKGVTKFKQKVVEKYQWK